MTLTLTDMFCGAGGSSTGAIQVPGIEVRAASNHWQLAVDADAVRAHLDDSLGNKRPSTSHRVRWRESAIRIAVDDALSDAMSELIDSGFSFDDVRDALALVDLVDLWDQERDS